MTWFLFVLFGGDYTDRLKRWEFASQYSCEQVKAFVETEAGVRALCVADGQTAAYGSDVQITKPVVEVKESPQEVPDASD